MCHCLCLKFKVTSIYDLLGVVLSVPGVHVSLDVIRALSPYGCYSAQQTDIYRGPTYLLTYFIYLFIPCKSGTVARARRVTHEDVQAD